MSAPVPKGSGILEVVLELDEGFPKCFNGGVGECPRTMPQTVAKVLSEAEWRSIVEVFDAETGCSAGTAALVLLLVPSFGLSFLCVLANQTFKAARINRKLQRVVGDRLKQRGGAIGFETGHQTSSNITVKPRLWIKPPRVSI